MTGALARARALAVVAGLAGAATAPAQDAVIAHRDGNRGVCTVRASVAGGSTAGAGLGFARIEIDNVDDRAHDFVVELSSARWQGSDVRTVRSLQLGGRESARFFLPVAIPPNRGRLIARVDGTTHETGIVWPRGNGLVGLFVSDRVDAAPDGLAALQAIPSRFGGPASQVPLRAVDLPADWRMYTSFPAVVVDGRAAVAADVQEALRRYAFAGGVAVVAAAERLPAGPLRELAVAAGRGIARHGLGHVVAVPPFGGDTTVMRLLLAEVPELGHGLWPAAEELFASQDIAGLGKAPVTVFVLVILLFAVLVGPVNFVLLRRRKKPLLALVTVPVLGFGTTFVILGYGIFHDGFGVRGVVTSWTVLDQARHEAVAVAARTLFAGLAPNELSMPQDSLVLSGRAGELRGEWPDRWHWDADRERLDGGVLPSRTVTPLLSVGEGPARQRLTVKRIGDDALEVLADGGIAPVGRMALCDLEGGFWTGADGRLRRVAAAEGRAEFAALANAALTLRVSGERGDVLDARMPNVTPRALGEPGTYLVRVAAAPWLDEHGLGVVYDAVHHWVSGRMHAQDFVQ